MNVAPVKDQWTEQGGRGWGWGGGGAIKNKFFRDGKSIKIQINDAKSFTMYADNVVKNVKSLYLSEDHL